MIRIGLIPAAGEGSRLHPLTIDKPKAMVKVGGKPLLQRNIEIMRDSLGIDKIYIIVGKNGEAIWDYFGIGKDFGVNISYIVQPKRHGIAKAIDLASGYLHEPFVVILGDELYLDTNHQELKMFASQSFDAICCFMPGASKEKISNNFTGQIKDGRVLSLIEKPQSITGNLLGCGTYVLDPIVFKYIDKTPPSALRGEVEITDVLNNMAASDQNVKAFMLKGEYINVNKVSDIDLAEKMIMTLASK